MRFTPILATACLALFAAACTVSTAPGAVGMYPAGASFGYGPQPEHSESRVDGEAIVVVLPGNSDILRFTVENLSNETMTIDRDAVLLDTSHGLRQRSSFAGKSTYTLAPGAMHDVNVRFSYDGLQPGERVAVLFDDAVTVGGRHVGLEPLPFVVR